MRTTTLMTSSPPVPVIPILFKAVPTVVLLAIAMMINKFLINIRTEFAIAHFYEDFSTHQQSNKIQLVSLLPSVHESGSPEELLKEVSCGPFCTPRLTPPCMREACLTLLSCDSTPQDYNIANYTSGCSSLPQNLEAEQLQVQPRKADRGWGIYFFQATRLSMHLASPLFTDVNFNMWQKTYEDGKIFPHILFLAFILDSADHLNK